MISILVYSSNNSNTISQYHIVRKCSFINESNSNCFTCVYRSWYRAINWLDKHSNTVKSGWC